MSAPPAAVRSAGPAPAVRAVHAEAVEDVARRLHTDVTSGLSSTVAASRLASSGPNALDDPTRLGWPALLRAQITSPMILLLAAAGVLSALLGDTAEALVILTVVGLNTWIGFRQEYRAARAMASLQDLARPEAVVVRDAAARTVPSRDLVAGDLVRLEAGRRVPADGRLVEAHALRVQESALTGESVPVDKAAPAVPGGTPLAERTSMVYAGTNVTAGRGTALVTATGMAGELGHIAGLLQGAAAGRTPLQRRLDALVRRLTALVGLVVATVTVLGALQQQPVETLVLTALSLAIAAVPESLPAVVTIALALGAQRMLRRRALVRNLYAVETLGSVTTICSDKTGTLTRNAMVVAVLATADERVDLAANQPVELAHPALHLLLVAGVLANDTAVGVDGALTGDPTETALVELGGRSGLDKHALDVLFPRVGELPFDAERKRMTTIHGVPAQPGPVQDLLRAPAGRVAFTKGALDGLLACCDTVLTASGPVALDERRRTATRRTGDELAADGLRVLGFAVRVWADPDAAPEQLSSESSLVLLGVQGLLDPPRQEVAAAVATCRSAGIRAVMITGDHPLTALAVARSLGIAGDHDTAVTGGSLAQVTDADLVLLARSTAVYARVSPEDKLRVVQALQDDGGVVAMTGDGVNDAPALEQADIGVAMGITGTDVTKDVADVVLQDDDFSTIVGAVREGRVVFDNICKFIRNILSGNLAEVSVMVVGPLLGMPLPLLPLQILWLNLATDGLPAIALAVEAPEPDAMARPPTALRESLLGADRGRAVVLRGAVLTLLTLVPALLLWRAGDEAWQSVLFTSLALAELAGSFAMRSETRPLHRLRLLSNRPLVLAVALTLALQVALVTLPPVRDLFGLHGLELRHWLIVAVTALAYVAAVELDKAARRGRAAPRPAGP